MYIFTLFWVNDRMLLAVGYTNLGNVYRIRGDLDQAVAMYEKALVLFQAVGAEPQIAKVQGLLDAVKEQQIARQYKRFR